MKHLYLIGLFFVCIAFVVLPVSANDISLSVSQNPATCINPGDLVEYSLFAEPVSEDPEAAWEFWIRWDPKIMIFEDFSAPCLEKEIKDGSVHCIEQGAFAMGKLKLKVNAAVLSPITTNVYTDVHFMGRDGNTDKGTQTTTEICTIDGPEFPSAIIPVIAMIGFVLSIMFVKRYS